MEIESKRRIEAKYYRDKSVLDNHNFEKNVQKDKNTAIEMLGVSEQNYDKIINKKINLKDLYKKYKTLLHIEDTNRIDIILATALSSRLEGIPIWLILVGSSGDMKTVQLNALEGFNTYYLQKITSKTLVNGFPNKEKYPDLAPKLNEKLVLIRDFATLMKLPPSEKAEIWGQLRDLYDGFAGTTSGMGTDVSYKDIKVTLIAASTPTIDGQILIHQDLGTRELIYRVKGNDDKNKAMEKCMENESCEKKISQELNEITINYLNNIKIKRKEPNEEEVYELKKIAIYLSHMRASGNIDSFSNTLLGDVYPEEPTRIIKQLKRLFICLKSLEDNYSTYKAMIILWKLAKSSAFQNRVKILNLLIKDMEEFSTSKIADNLRIGKSTAQRELNILWNLNFITCRKEPTSYPDRTYDYWKVNIKNKNLEDLIRTVRDYNIRV